MNQILKSIACVAIFAGIGFVVSQQMQTAPQSRPEKVVTENADRELPRAPVPEHGDQMPPTIADKGTFGHINKDRLAVLAGQPYNGPSYKEDYAQEIKMVAERKAAAKKDRMPANSRSK